MPHTYTATFPLRYYECDSFGVLHLANYLRLATQAAVEASAAVGYDLNRYDALGKFWLIREVHFEHLKPVHLGETLNIKTWVEDFRRVRSRRRFEFQVADALVARGSADWVFIERETGQPTRAPDEMKRAFFPEGVPAESDRPTPFPEQPAAPRGAFHARRRVAWPQLDSAGHLNSAAYLDWLVELNDNAAAAVHWGPERTDREGFTFGVQEYQIEYLLPAYFDDEVQLTTFISEIGETQVMRHYALQRGPELLARAQVMWGCVDLETDNPRQIPDEWVLDFSKQVADEEDVNYARMIAEEGQDDVEEDEEV